MERSMSFRAWLEDVGAAQPGQQPGAQPGQPPKPMTPGQKALQMSINQSVGKALVDPKQVVNATKGINPNKNVTNSQVISAAAKQAAQKALMSNPNVNAGDVGNQLSQLDSQLDTPAVPGMKPQGQQ
jgi:hypothetical protein